jgi:predicted ferric reductase
MFDFLLRALRSPMDYYGIFKKNTLVFRECIDEGNGNFSFIFDFQAPIKWKAGQHGVFTLPDQNVSGKTWRAFSIASSAIENEIRIGTTIPPAPSDFKQKMLDLNPGETIDMHGPFGEFHLNNCGKHIVAIAGGIGITPLRAIMVELVNDLHPDVTLELIYAGKNNYFTYNDSCEEFNDHPNVSITYLDTPEEVNTAIDQPVNVYRNTATYCISGAPRMIGAIKKRLIKAGIKKIITDPFKGY